MFLTIVVILVATIAVASLEMWLFWRLGGREQRPTSVGSDGAAPGAVDRAIVAAAAGVGRGRGSESIGIRARMATVGKRASRATGSQDDQREDDTTGRGQLIEKSGRDGVRAEHRHNAGDTSGGRVPDQERSPRHP